MRTDQESAVSEQSQQWSVGSAVITSVVEHAVAGIPPEAFFPHATTETVGAHAWLSPEFASDDGLISLAVRAFVVQTGGRTILVDPCVGNGKTRLFPLWNEAEFPFLERLAAAGFEPRGIETVIHTHLHPDHVGWDTRLTDGRWTPTFDRARHLYTRTEAEFWREPAQRQAEDVWSDSIEPIFDAGLADTVEDDEDLGGGLRLAPTPGHTPGHVSLWIESEGEAAVISGDVLTHPLQCAEPHLAHVADWDADVCRTSRQHFLETVQARNALLLVNHFPGRCGGHVRNAQSGYVFSPAEALTLASELGTE
jgi:glyoxylase-like metal-dependent hydrolase (beta-lactamase superfamily II)